MLRELEAHMSILIKCLSLAFIISHGVTGAWQIPDTQSKSKSEKNIQDLAIAWVTHINASQVVCANEHLLKSTKLGTYQSHDACHLWSHFCALAVGSCSCNRKRHSNCINTEHVPTQRRLMQTPNDYSLFSMFSSK